MEDQNDSLDLSGNSVKTKKQRKPRSKTKMFIIAISIIALLAAIALVVTQIVLPIIEENSKKNSKWKAIENAQPGDVVEFGDYSGLKNWIVLTKDGDKVFMITENCIDRKAYNKVRTETSWQDCTLRSWLNESFINAAFSLDEREMLIETDNVNEANAKYSQGVGCANTMDKAFLISESEFNKYMASFEVGKRKAKYNEAFAWWWLRTPGFDMVTAEGVGTTGAIMTMGGSVHDLFYVRPAVWIDLSKRK